jgi:hypothetical protein
MKFLQYTNKENYIGFPIRRVTNIKKDCVDFEINTLTKINDARIRYCITVMFLKLFLGILRQYEGNEV